MNDTKPATHTPGPWRTTPPTGGGECNIFGSNNELLAHTYRTQSADEANARLIAAAPALLAALEDTLPILESMAGYWEYVRDNPESPSQITDALTNLAALETSLSAAREAIRLARSEQS